MLAHSLQHQLRDKDAPGGVSQPGLRQKALKMSCGPGSQVQPLGSCVQLCSLQEQVCMGGTGDRRWGGSQ